MTIAKDLQPHIIVENPGFRVVIESAEPRYVISSRKTFAEVSFTNYTAG